MMEWKREEEEEEDDSHQFSPSFEAGIEPASSEYAVGKKESKDHTERFSNIRAPTRVGISEHLRQSSEVRPQVRFRTMSYVANSALDQTSVRIPY